MHVVGNIKCFTDKPQNLTKTFRKPHTYNEKTYQPRKIINVLKFCRFVFCTRKEVIMLNI